MFRPPEHLVRASEGQLQVFTTNLSIDGRHLVFRFLSRAGTDATDLERFDRIVDGSGIQGSRKTPNP